MVSSDIRNYEVSIWTLQDGFISVLKYATLENKGQIQEPELKIVDDGTQEFTFKIPMYILQDGKRIQNPIWYNTTNGVIVASTRKIKVIINKKDAVRQVSQQRATQDEEVFQFIITKVTQTHQNGVLTCEVSCEGLAFHQLGKIGYKIDLSQDEFMNEYGIWSNSTETERQQLNISQPRATIQYWNNKIFDRIKYWTYQVNMNWDGYGGRDSDKVYQDTYVSSWDRTTGLPKKIQAAKEKQRLLDIAESNVYNLTQTIAQTFGVHCKYVYEHDNNYNIIGKKVVYYNNFLNQTYGALDFTYPYNTSSISREADSTNLITKMYIKPVNSDTSRDGFITILDTAANKSGEDYLLNFDYMHTVGSITDEQYNGVFEFQRKIAIINEQLGPLGEEILKLEQIRLNVQADLATYDRGRKLAEQRYTQANALLNSITEDTGILHVTAERPTNGILLQNTGENNNYFINISQTGIIPESFHIYRKYSYTATGKDRVADQIFGTFQFDQFNNLIKVNNIVLNNSSNSQSSTFSRSVYLTYDYQPLQYIKRVKSVWGRKMASDESQYEKATAKIEKIDNSLKDKRQRYEQLLLEKQKQIQNFQMMMGPALRQGYWLPDQYNDYGDKLKATFQNGFSTGQLIIDSEEQPIQDSQGNYCYSYDQNFLDENKYAIPIWDAVPFDGEQLPYYESGINRDKEFYPCIKLTSEQLECIQNNDNISLIFYDLKNNQTQKNYRSFAIGSECQLGLLKDKDGNVFPILIVLGAKDMTEQQIKNMQTGGDNDIVYSQLTSFEKETTYPSSETIVKINSQLSEKTVKQLIVTTNAEDEKINEKTVIKKYEIITKQKKQQQQQVIPEQQESTFQQIFLIGKNYRLGRSATSTLIRSNKNEAISGNNKISFEVIVASGYWAYTRIVIKNKNTIIYTNSNQYLSQGTNRIDCNNLYNIQNLNDISIEITLKEDYYSLLINNINVIITLSGKNTISSEYQITQQKIDTEEEQLLKQVIIQEKNLFHQNPIQFTFNITYEDNNSENVIAYFNGTEIENNSTSYSFSEEFIEDNNYIITQNYAIDYNNKKYLLNSRTIKINNDNQHIYSEVITQQGATIEDTRKMPLTESYIIKTLRKASENSEESSSSQEQQNESNLQDNGSEQSEQIIQLFDIIIDKYTFFDSSIDTQACLGKFTYNNDKPQMEGIISINPNWERTASIDPVTHKISYEYNQSLSTSDWLSLSNDNYGQNFDNSQSNQYYISVFPRIQINSLKLKQTDTQLSILYNDRVLKKYEDYRLLTRNDKYYLCLKLEELLEVGKYNDESQNSSKLTLENNRMTIPKINLYYCLSNADTSIYLDAVQVLKQNAFPKVSYEIDVNMINPDFIRTIYNKMGYIAHINDNQLKFEEVLGYISEITMHLDKPWEDQIVIKNYKTDFENLFSTIVASSQDMKKNAYTIGLAAGAFDSTGNLSIESIQQALAQRGIVYNFNNGKLTINQKDGIVGASESGIVNFRCDGIFTASQKNENEDWIWNTAITPNGINADLITTGQLDTNLVKIFAGDRLRFQLNQQGLFGYKSFLEDFNDSSALQRIKDLQNKWNSIVSNNENESENEYNNFDDYLNSFNNSDGYTELQYVKFNENGLFLIAEKDANVYINNSYQVLPASVTRVQVSWDGLKLRNWNNDEVFWADPDSGDLYITGTIFADSFKVLNSKAELNDEDISPVTLDDYMTFKFEDNVKKSQNLERVFNIAGDILIRAWSSLTTLNGNNIQNAEILNGFLEKAKQLPHQPIQLVTGNGDNTASALILHPTQGIWMGSTDKIVFYSGNSKKMSRNNNTGEYESPLDGATVTIDKSQILLGVSNISTSSSSGGAVQITSDKIVLAVGQNYTSDISYNILKNNSSISGVVITRDSIGLATQVNGQRNLILMDQAGIMIGTATMNDSLNNGSFVKISNDGIIIGSNSNLFINTNNLILDTSVPSLEWYSPIVTYKKNDTVIYNYEIYTYKNDTSSMGNIPASTSDYWERKAENAYAFKLGDKLEYSSGKLTITGDIYANSFILNNTEIKTSINGTTTSYNLNTISSQASSALSHSMTALRSIPVSTTTDYILTNESICPAVNDSRWSSTRPSSSSGYYLWIKKTSIYDPNSGKSPTYDYSCEYYPINGNNGSTGPQGPQGEQGISLSTSVPLYYLKISIAPSQPVTISNSDITDSWTTVVPTYVSDGQYYTCYKYTWSNNTTSYSSIVPNYGLTIANTNATSASTLAQQTATAVQPITVNGIAGNVVWNGTTYGVVLGNTSTSNSMLIGSNSGITIVGHYFGYVIDDNGIEYEIEHDNNDNNIYYRIIDGNKVYYTISEQSIIDGNNNVVGTIAHIYTQNPAIVMDKSGIALNGASLNFTAAGGDSTLILNSEGINMAALGEVRIQGNEGFIQFGNETVDNNGELTNENITFRVDQEGNMYCKKLICEEAMIGNNKTSYVNNNEYIVYLTEDTTVYGIPNTRQITFIAPGGFPSNVGFYFIPNIEIINNNGWNGPCLIQIDIQRPDNNEWVTVCSNYATQNHGIEYKTIYVGQNQDYITNFTQDKVLSYSGWYFASNNINTIKLRIIINNAPGTTINQRKKYIARTKPLKINGTYNTITLVTQNPYAT